jgi:hypothetical protein
MMGQKHRRPWMRISFYNNEKKIFEMENVSQKYK